MKLPARVRVQEHPQYLTIEDADGLPLCRVHRSRSQGRFDLGATIAGAINSFERVSVPAPKLDRLSWLLRDYAEMLETCALGCDPETDKDTLSRVAEARAFADHFDALPGESSVGQQ